MDYRLCYMEELDDYIFKAFFTLDYENQWGDDWNDRPADCNAGEPYDDNDIIKYLIIELPQTTYYNDIIFGAKNYSVQDLNKGEAKWLICNDISFAGGDSYDSIILRILKYNQDKKKYEKIHIYKDYEEVL